MELRYEDLVRDPATALQAVCAFLGEDFEPAMLDTAARTELVPARERHIHTKLAGPINQDLAGGWRRRTSLFECAVLEACLGADLRRNGYGLRFAGAASRLLLRGFGGLLKALQPVLAVAIPALRRRGLIRPRFYI